MTEEAEIKRFIDRILRLKEEQDTLGEDIREVYAEAKGRGYDKTVLGNVVSHLRKVEKLGRDTLSEREAIFEMYLTAYETGDRALASARTRENIEEFPVNTKLAATVANAVQTETGRKALIAAVDIMIEREEHLPNSPKTADEMHRADGINGTADPILAAENARKAVPETEDGSVSHAGADESSAADERNVEATVEQRSSATNSIPALVRKEVNIRPHCQHPGSCAGYGSNHCYACKKQMAEVAR